MKNIFAILLSVFLCFLTGCYQTTPPSNIKADSFTAKTNADSADSTVKPAETTPEIQTAKGGDYDAALNFYNSRNYEKAIGELEQVVQKDTKNHQAQFYLGKSYQGLNKTNDAISAYQKAIEIKPDYAEANFELGNIHYNKKEYEKSLPFLEKASKLKYTSPEYLVALGDNYRTLNRCNYAVVPYGKASGFDDKNTGALHGMGLCYIELKNRIAAAQQVRNLEQIDKNLAKKLFDKIPK